MAIPSLAIKMVPFGWLEKNKKIKKYINNNS